MKKNIFLIIIVAIFSMLLGSNTAVASEKSYVSDEEKYKVYISLGDEKYVELESAKENVEAVRGTADVTSGKCGDNLNWNYNIATHALTITGTGDMYDYEANEYGESSAPWGKYSRIVESLSLPQGITHIGACAFDVCTSLRELTIPDSVRSIGCKAFYLCSSLTNINIPNGVETIEDFAFDGVRVNNVVIPSSVKHLGYDCFDMTVRTITFDNVTLEDVYSLPTRYFNADRSLVCAVPADTLLNGTYSQVLSLNGEDGLKYKGVCGDYWWTINNEGVFELTGRGDVEFRKSLVFFVDKDGNEVPGYHINMSWKPFLKEIKKIKLSIKGTSSLLGLCSGMVNATSVEFINCDFSKAIATSCMFDECHSLKTIKMNNMNMPMVCDADMMFSGCKNIENINLDGTHMPNVVSLAHFCGQNGGNKNEKLKTFSWKDSQIKNAKCFRAMFQACPVLENVDITSFDTSKVTEYGWMFFGNFNIKSINLGNFDMSKAQEATNMFFDCNNLVEINSPKKTGSIVPDLPRTLIDVSTGQKYNSIPKKLTKSIDLRTGYSINYELKGGSNNSANPHYYNIQTATIKLKKATRKGYLFDGWYTSSKYTKKKTEIVNGSKGDITLYAKWTPIKYTIKFNANGGKGSMKSIKADYTKKVKLTKNTFTRKGYKFLGWSTDKKAKKAEFKDLEKVTKLAEKNGTTVTLYAIWKKKK